MNSQELIESYVHEVGQRLPRKMRADIELELRSLLADALEERGDDETTVIEFLSQLGSPAHFAAQYLPHQYLVGPKLFPTFKLVATIVFSVITTLTAATIGYTLIRFGTPENFLRWWGQEMNDYVRSLIFILGMLTLLFTFLEWVGVGAAKIDAVWDPTTLRPVKDPNRINRTDLISDVIGAIVSIWVFTSLPDWIGTDGGGLFTNGYLVHTPWLLAGWVLEIILKLTVVRNGRWDTTARTFQIAIQAFDIFVIYRIVTGVTLVSVEFFDSGLKVALGIALIVISIDTLIKLYKLIAAPKQLPTPVRSKAA